MIDDAGALEIIDLYRVLLGVDIYLHHTIEQPEYIESITNVNEEHDVNYVVEEVLSKLHEDCMIIVMSC